MNNNGNYLAIGNTECGTLLVLFIFYICSLSGVAIVTQIFQKYMQQARLYVAS